MYNETIARLEKFDNQHEFERMCADILAALGYREVTPIAPRGGSDEGMDIRFSTESGGKGLACVTLRKDIKVKFKEDFEQRQAGDFEKYMFFCIAYVPAPLKREFAQYCLERLQAELVTQDIEALRCYLDSPLTAIREQYLGIPNPKDEGSKALLIQMRNEAEARLLLYDAHKTYGNAPLKAEPLIQKAVKQWPAARQEEYKQLGMSMATKVIEQVIYFNLSSSLEPDATGRFLRKYGREEIGQLIRGAIGYLQETVWEVSSSSDLEELAHLACMYGYQHQFSQMLEVIDRSLTCGQDVAAHFQEPIRLVALLSACERDQARVRQLARKIGLSDVTETTFCQAIRDPDHLKHNGFIKWLALKDGDLASEKSGVTIVHISPPSERNGGLVAAFTRPVKSGEIEKIIPVDKPISVEQLYNTLVQSFWLITPLPREYAYL